MGTNVREGKFTITEVRRKGFTDRLICDLLPEPECVTNPMYVSSPPMKLFREEDVLQAMQTKEFLEFQEKRQVRKEAAQKATLTRKQHLLDNVKKSLSKLKVRQLPFEEVKRRTLREKQEWDMLCGSLETVPMNGSFVNQKTLDRWCVNYIRHHLTVYDEVLERLDRKTGKQEAYELAFTTILHKIGEAYPMLQEECERQIEQKEMEWNMLRDFAANK